ncbi:hypothetical protein [Embleya scabrispora]|uniref:hypothetical protein n=1 Tax=Embleya scabrispora TaxID=159449 RepID=UPI001374E2F0|nr:hypothetical protein [Embleya scabrispora]
MVLPPGNTPSDAIAAAGDAQSRVVVTARIGVGALALGGAVAFFVIRHRRRTDSSSI